MKLSTPIAEIAGIGPVFQKRFKAMGIATARDILFRFPKRYEDWSRLTPLAELKEGGEYCVKGIVKQISSTTTFKRRMSVTTALVQDDTGAIKVVWFNQPYLAASLPEGQGVLLAGKVVSDKYGLYLSSPSHEKTDEHAQHDPVHTGRLVPVYEETSGVTSRFFRSLVHSVFLNATITSQDTLPEEIIAPYGFPPLQKALNAMHFPSSAKEAGDAKKRFAFEELFFILLFIQTERKKIARAKAPAIPFKTEHMQKFTAALPFLLTDDQKKSAWHILKDMEKPRPMNRLLQGDVGSGKTVVAAMAALAALKAGYQAAFLSPTEILAHQHFKTVAKLLRPFKVDIGLLTGSADRFISHKLPNEVVEISRAKLLKKTQEGSMPLLVGTHALIQKTVRFGNLGLIIVDEQHRFGVEQRAALLRKPGLIPHLLSMTATPIPRTLAMTIYGDLDLSLIKELPKGRKNIITRVIPPAESESMYERIRSQIKEGRQAFVICPRIEEHDASQHSGRGWDEAKSVKIEYELLSKKIFPEYRVGMLHGKLPAKEKEYVMKEFKRGKTHLLVSTSVVEVGVDIPNAAVMLIEGAEYFGLAQLHQFRGRVGRGEHQSYCFLRTSSKAASTRRLKAIEKTASGFELAEIDLKLRGPGDFVGTKQWGMPDFAMEQLTNQELVQKAKQAAQELLEKDIALSRYPAIRERVEEMRHRLHLE